MKECNHIRKSGTTYFRKGIIEAECWGCGKIFFMPIDQCGPEWFIDRLKGILTAVKIFESVNNDDGTTTLRPIQSECCKYT